MREDNTMALLAKLFSSLIGKKLLIALLRELAKRTDNTIDDAMVRALEEALTWVLFTVMLLNKQFDGVEGHATFYQFVVNPIHQPS